MNLEISQSQNEIRLILTGPAQDESAAELQAALLAQADAAIPQIIDTHGLDHLRLDVLQVLMAFVQRQTRLGKRPLIFCAQHEAEYLRLLGLQTNGLEEFFHA